MTAHTSPPYPPRPATVPPRRALHTSCQEQLTYELGNRTQPTARPSSITDEDGAQAIAPQPAPRGQTTREADQLLSSWFQIARPVEDVTARLEATLSQRHGICLSAFEVMSSLSAHRGWKLLSQVCGEVSRSQPRISRLVTQMEGRGLVNRTKVPGDGRATQLRLTSEGDDVFAAAGDTLVEILRGVTADEGPLADRMNQLLR